MWTKPLIGQVVKYRSVAKNMIDNWHDENMVVVGRRNFDGAEEPKSALILESKIDEYYAAVGVTFVDDVYEELGAAFIGCTYIDLVVDYYGDDKLLYVSDSKELVTVVERIAMGVSGKYIRYKSVVDGTIYLSAWHNLRPIK